MKKIKEIIDNNMVLRYIISGGFSSALDILLFVLFIEVFSLHYLISITISTTISFVVRFYLQKVFAFKDSGLDIRRQLVMYSILYVSCLTTTALLLYIFIDILHIWYFFAQIMSIAIVASTTFFIYKNIVFKKSKDSVLQKI